MKSISLNGVWTLRGRSTTDPQKAPIHLTDATVPGMAQLELSRHGILPTDLYMGMNITQTEQYEDWEWWYEREFDAPAEHERAFLVFRGVDCFAEYFLNGERIGESANMFIPFEFDVSKLLKTGKNTVTVHLKSSAQVAHGEQLDLHCMANGGFSMKGLEMLYARRPAHSYGWDIMPRAVTCGLWRDVVLELRDVISFEQLFIDTRNPASILVAYDTVSALSDFQNVDIEVELTCRDSHYRARRNHVPYKAGRIVIPIDKKPYLWWPYGYGEANLYRVTARIYSNGNLVCETHTRTAFRTVELDRTDHTDGKNGKFRFLINGTEIMAKGSNWVPMDAFHSRDKSRYAKALALVKDIGCNILRCWGGNVYEDHEFFDFCDENGIMVWQDFSMACFNYPCDERMERAIREEAVSIVRRYRHHPSIILWSGDNEVDSGMRSRKYVDVIPSHNTLTRKILPNVVERNDLGRPYLASSPYISDAASEDLTLHTAETHLWGSRDYFKSYEYRSCPAHFISEAGYHGCPAPESIRKFITPEKVWPYFDNEEWTLHSSDQHQNDSRVMLMHKQVLQLFGEVPDNLDDYAVASQISQAEAFKYLIERMRVARPDKSGIIWWNLIDGWPQMSDAVVDYYYNKKLAYHYIKRSQAPFAICADELAKWKLRIYACNDTPKKQCGHLRVFDIDTDQTLAELDFTAAENTSTELCALPIFYSEKRFLVFRWEIDDKTAYNHYLCGFPAFDLSLYRKWLEKYQTFTNFP